LSSTRRETRRRQGRSGGGALLSRKRLAAVFGTATAVVAFLIGVTNLTDWVQRKFDDPEPPPPAKIDAQITGVHLSSARQSLEDYLLSTGAPLRGLTRRERDELGFLFEVGVRLTGSQGERFPLLWSLRGARSGVRVPGPAYAQLAVTFVPRGREHARTWPVWVPYPPRKSSYFLRVTLTDKKGQPVDMQESKPFTVDRVPN
jgi:hypothetical protein